MDRKVVQEIKRLTRQHGELTPEQVVEHARDASSPLHDHLTWDDNAAAAKYRLLEARDLLRRVRVHIVPQAPSAEINVRPLVLPADPTAVAPRPYAPLVAPTPVAAEPPKDPLTEALAELQRLRTRFADQAELRSVFAEVDKLLQQKMSPADYRARTLNDAVAFACDLERSRGFDRQTAIDRAMRTFGVGRVELLEGLRKAS